MDPLTVITTALIVGATAALQETAGQAVKDAYSGFKSFLVSRFQSTKAAVELLEGDPADEDSQKVVNKQLTKAQAASDEALLDQAKALLTLIKTQAPQATTAAGVIFEDFDFADELSIDGVTSTGDGVTVRRGTAQGKVEIKNVQAGQRSADPNA